MKKFLLVLLFASAGPQLLVGDDHNPAGVTGAFEGVTTTGGAYNVLNHTATRQIDDIVVPGAIGKYGLKMTRYYNSRSESGYWLMVGGWSHEYRWSTYPYDEKLFYPNGSEQDTTCLGDWGVGLLAVSDAWETHTSNGNGNFRLADGGTVVFQNHRATSIIDPYGQTTTITYYPNSWQMNRVTEPGGRYLQFNYSQVNGVAALSGVDAYDGRGNRIDWVAYHYTAISTGGQSGLNVNCLTSVDYSDGTHAYYTYQPDNVLEHLGPPCPCSVAVFPVLKTCKDVRYKGPMRNIRYEYQAGPHGAILTEKYWDGISGHEGNGPMVSRIDPPAPSPLVFNPNFETRYTEYRGDGPTRTFTYTPLHLGRPSDETCPRWTQDPTTNPAPQQFLTDYTDFRGNSTHLGYDPNWYVNSVRDANNNTTSYTRGPPPSAYPGPCGIGQILTITYPGGAHVDYGYHDESPNISGHYVRTVSNERQKVTTYTRDPNTLLVIRIDYPSDANTPASSEQFTYNAFGQVLNHKLRNGAWESFVYDGRGLLTDKYNPKATVPGGTDPHIHYDYYTAADGRLGWIDRVKKVSLPANWLGHVASETYEYERTYDANGVTNLNGGAVAGRGLPTKVTHADGKYQQFKYDWYGNKVWQDDELRNQTSHTYDDYNRVTSTTDPLQNSDSFGYLKPGASSSYLHTTSSLYTYTSRAGIVTTNAYDENFRKTSTSVAGQSTWFHYDNVGNQDYVTDPRGTGSGDSAYTTYTDYDNRNRKWQVREPLGHTTKFYYDDGINITRIIRPDTTTETKSYDAINRVLTDTVPKTANPVVNLTTWFTYNPSGTIWKVTDARGSGPGDANYTTTFTYDASDRKTMMTYPPINNHSDTQQWQYDDAGNLDLRTTVNNDQEAFFYDVRNFKYASWWNNNWNNGIVDWCFFDHDATGRLTEAENGTNGWNTNIISDVHRSYDAAGHLTQEQQIVTGLGTKTVQYPSYDDDGRLTRMYVSGATGYDFTYSYDATGRFEKIFLTNSAQLFQYRYDAASNETERDNIPNGVNQLYSRDALNRMTTWDARKGNSTLSHEGYTYDAMNRIKIVDWANGNTDSFNYYLDGELQQANLGNFGHNITYNLDKAGNRTSVVDNNVPSSYSPNPINQYTTGAGSTVVNGPEHEISDYQAVHYTYINDERLRSVATGTTTYSMVYDALGRCVKRTLSSGPTTYYLYDGEKPILEYDASGTSVGVNVYGKGIDEILERVAIGSDNQWHTCYLQQNHEGSVTLLTNSTGSVVERYRYDAYGAPTIYASNWSVRSSTIYNNRFLFTGREYAATYRSTYNTPAFNFYEYRARAYNPTLGRFMSEDPKLFDAGDYNLFRYCHNDPIDFIDPMGLYSGRDFIIDSWSYSLEALGAIAGFTAGGGGSALASGGVLAPAGAVAGAAVGATGGYATGRYVGTKLADLVTHKEGTNNPQASKGQQEHQAATNANKPMPDSSSVAKTEVFRQGTFAKKAIDWKGSYVKGREWAKDNPLTTPNYAQRYGLPAENTGKPDWVVGGRVQGPYTTRPAPPSNNNPLNTGGATEVLPQNPNKVRLDWFHMP